MSETNINNSDIAIERVVGFAQKFNRVHLDLACHAAFPQTLTPELLYQIWLRFVPQAPWTAVARIILSRLCREVGYELYEMDIDVRNLLLTELKEDKRFGEQRLNELAEFYNNYLKYQFGSEEKEEEDPTQPQYWIALAFTNSKQKLSQEIAKAIESKLKQKNWKELFRLASFIEAVPQALVKFEPPFINYARGMLNFTTGDLEGAAEEFSKLQRRERQVDIAGVNLSIPDEVPLVEDPEESASQLFRRLTADIANTLTSNAERFEVMEKGYRNWQQVVSGSRAVIGIYLEQDEKTKEVIVSGIEEKQVAYLAEIMPQDEILKIDGKLIHGLDKHQVLENLGGKPGTQVTITVRRSNQELEFQLTRGKIEINSAQRQAELVKNLTFFADSLNRLRESCKNNLNKINTSAQRIAQNQEEPVSALLSVTRYIENQIIQLNQETNIVINRKKELFSEQKEVLQELEFIFSQLKVLGEGAEIQIQNLDAREEKIIRIIENDKDLSPIEKRFFRAIYTDIIARLSFFNELKLEYNFIKKTDAKKLFHRAE